MKTVLITGTSSGIGYSSALEFARQGYQVVATMRNLASGEALQAAAAKEGLSIDIRQLDVTDTEAIKQVVAGVVKDYENIDVLVNNAGAGCVGTTEQTSDEQARKIMDANFFGTRSLTHEVLPHMRRQQAGHIISVTSIGGILGVPFNDIYCAAKAAVEGMMESLAPVMKKFGVHVSVVEPGPVNTKFVENIKTTNATLFSRKQPDAYGPMLQHYLAGSAKIFAQLGQTPDEVARLIHSIAENASPDLRYQTSGTITKMVAGKLTDPTGNSLVSASAQRLA